MDRLSKKSPRLMRALLATTCLSAATGGTALAGTITEGVGPAPADFPNSGPGYLLPVGTTTVFGTKLNQLDQDWFEFQGLTPGASFSLSAFFNPSGTEIGLRVSLFDTSENSLGSSTLEQGTVNSGNEGNPILGTVPSDGNIIVDIFSCGCLNPSGGYEVQLTEPAGSVPEPSTMATVGLGLAGALAWRRRRKS